MILTLVFIRGADCRRIKVNDSLTSRGKTRSEKVSDMDSVDDRPGWRSRVRRSP
jgi:hypothetical protein